MTRLANLHTRARAVRRVVFGLLTFAVCAGAGCDGAPSLVTPLSGDVLDNGCEDLSDAAVWDFEWTGVEGASEYHLIVEHTPSPLTLIDEDGITATSYHHAGAGAFVIEDNRFGWAWRVRAKVGPSWGPWSETRSFEVEPLNTDCVGVPALLYPDEGAELDNGCLDHSDPTEWDFTWAGVLGASEYEVRVESPGGVPVIDTVTAGCWHHREDDAYVIDANRLAWKWKVRAKVDGMWGPWSEERSFDLEPLDSDCTGVPDFAHPDRPHIFYKDQWSCELQPLRPRTGAQPLLVILVEFPDSLHDPADPSQTPGFFEDVVFGVDPSVRGYFQEVSHGNYAIANAGVLGWYEAPHQSDWYFCSNPCDRHYQDLAADVVGRAVVDGFPFGAFDADGDGEIVRDELAVLMILTDHTFLGLSFVLRTRHDQDIDVGLFTPGGIEVDTNATRVPASALYPETRFALYGHELGHGLLGLLDLYADGYGGDPASLFSIMAVSGSLFTPHLDPWAKIHLGWIEPIVVTATGYYDVRAVEEHAEAYILYDPARGPDEYFIVENRWPPASAYEAGLPEQGLAIWHITEYYDDEPFDYNRGRKMIGMKWGADSTVANHNELWDGSDPDTAYDFTDASLPRNARWADGSPSGIQITEIPEAGPVMRVHFSVPPP